MPELLIPNASDWINAFDSGQQAGMIQRKTRAVTQAGGLMASGDYAGAARSLYGAGDFQSGSAIANAGYQETERTDKLARQKTVQDRLAAGDFSGAYAAAGTDADLLGGLEKVSAHAKETAGIMAGALQALKGLPIDQARAKYQAMKPGLLSRGLPQDKLDAFDPTPEGIGTLEAGLLSFKDQLELNAPKVVGSSLVRPTGEVVFQDDKFEKVDNGDGSQSIVRVGRHGSGGQGPAPSAPAAAPTGGVYDQVGQLAQENGAKPAEVSYLQRLAQVESSGNPAARNGSSTGVFQFHPDTFHKLGGRDINSVPEQTFAALQLQRQDRSALQSMGVEPTDDNAYIMHQQGAGGGRALLTSDPSANAVQVLTPVYGNAETARKAIVNNGGSPDMTAGQFVGMWRQRWAGGGARPAAAAGPAQGGSGAEVVYRGEAGPGESDGLTPDAIHLLAGRYLKDGSIPPLGMGKNAAAARQRILNEATAMAKAIGATAEDLVAGTLSVKAAGQALGKATQLRSLSEGFEQTALKNADLMLSLAPKGAGPTSIPVMNRWIQAGRKQISGDPDVTSFDIALGTFADEYAKIVSGSTGSQGSTDSSRKEAYDRLSKYASQGQLQAGIDTMKREMANRIDSLHEVESGLRAQIRGGGSGQGPPNANTGPPSREALSAKGYSDAQSAYIARTQGQPRAPAGEQANPFVPVNEGQYKALKPGAWYVTPDGDLLQKKAR